LKKTFKIVGEAKKVYSDEELKVFRRIRDSTKKTTRTHANIVERLKLTIKKGVADRIRFTKGNWTDLN